MRITTVRRISQVFFVLLFFWFCVTATVGVRAWQLRGWPINWILSLDPLTAFSTMLTTGTLYLPLLWALAAIVLTVFVGRFFCGFVCPMGALNQFFGWIGQRGRTPLHEQIEANRYRRAQEIKTYLLIFLLACAVLGSLQTGIFDPLPLLHRSINLTLAPLFDRGVSVLSPQPRFYEAAWAIGAILLAVLGLNLLIPRFFCRFLCPLGALFGLLNRFSPWRIGKERGSCGDCHLCETRCEGGCRPSGRIVGSECVLCFNCLDQCPSGRLRFAGRPSQAGEAPLPDLSRRGLLAAGAVGLLAGPMMRLGGLTARNGNPLLIRPPGALDEERFLARCIRCGQCMRVCPTNVIQPATFEGGLEGLWTPILNYRIGASGCQLNCVACGQVCPTAALRPLSLEEKLGTGSFAQTGPVRMGTAFVDRSRCIPWALGRPCIVCQEVCPVSPKAITTQVAFETVRNGRVKAVRALADTVEVSAPGPLDAGFLAGGDCYLRQQGEAGFRRIASVSGSTIGLAGSPTWTSPPAAGAELEIVVKLQRPCVDVTRCIGCGVCEHECPISRLRGIRVTSENESRTHRGRMLA